MKNILTELEQLLGMPVASAKPMGGGSIDRVYRIECENQRYCLKLNHNVPADFFFAEKIGLETLAASNSIRVPSIRSHGENYLLLEWLEPALTRDCQPEQLGRNLAMMHQNQANHFGFERNNYCGKTPQVNSPCKDGFEFFAMYRLTTQIELASDAGLLSKNDINILESIARKLDQFIPKQPASLLHGDLWNGNVVYSQSGPALIDPATYYGWAEADLAMTRLFGGFDENFYQSYQEVRPLEPGFEERVPLYNLYHLLNHLNLFGSGWYDSVMAVARQYALSS